MRVAQLTLWKNGDNVTEETSRFVKEKQDSFIDRIVAEPFARKTFLFSTNRIFERILYDLWIGHHQGIGAYVIARIIAFSEHVPHNPTMTALHRTGTNSVCHSHPKRNHLSAAEILSALAGLLVLHQLFAGGKEVSR